MLCMAASAVPSVRPAELHTSWTTSTTSSDAAVGHPRQRQGHAGDGRNRQELAQGGGVSLLRPRPFASRIHLEPKETRAERTNEPGLGIPCFEICESSDVALIWEDLQMIGFAARLHDFFFQKSHLFEKKILYSRSAKSLQPFTYFKTRPIFCAMIFKIHLIWDQKVGLIINIVRGCKLMYLQLTCT
jgi:hypothetical protein